MDLLERVDRKVRRGGKEEKKGERRHNKGKISMYGNDVRECIGKRRRTECAESVNGKGKKAACIGKMSEYKGSWQKYVVKILGKEGLGEGWMKKLGINTE